MKLPSALVVILTALVSNSCGNGLLVPLEISANQYCAAPGDLSTLAKVSEDDVSEDVSSLTSQANTLLTQGDLQKAAWLFRRIPAEQTQADQLEQRIENILKTSSYEIQQKDLGGATEKLFLYFPTEKISAVYKPDGGDLFLDMDAEVGAYLVSKTFKMNLVPTTVKRNVKGKDGSVQYFVTDTTAGGGVGSKNFRKLMIFDFLVFNYDRDFAVNYLYWAAQDRVIAIDHGQAFKTRCGVSSEIKKQLDVEKTLATRLRSISKSDLYSALSSVRGDIADRVWDQINLVR